MSERLALYLLGPPRLELDRAAVSIDRRKTLALLAYLAVDRWQHHRDHVSALLWPEYEQAKAFTNLRHILWEVQQAIGEGWVVASRDTVGLIPDANPSLPSAGAERFVWLDVACFQSLIAEARTQREVTLRIPLLTDSVKLYRDHFLTGFSLKNSPHFNEWASAESDALRHQLAGALTLLSNDYCLLGQAEMAIPFTKRLVALDPLNEAFHRQLMQVFIQAGQHNAALKQYQTCEQILRKELGVDPQPETRLLYKQIRRGDTIPLRPVKRKETRIAPPHNLPFQISKFIGRERELADITDLIANNRLVTLIGTGGIGKTRLSLKVGEQLLEKYSNGVWFVELAALSDPARVPQTVAALFRLVDGSEELLTEKLIRVLHPKTMLLILDNCEHLLDPCAQLAYALLRNCPSLKILTTSRESLGITGEAQYHVPPLGLPDLQGILEKLLDYESVELFEERARLVQEDFSLTIGNASSIAQICQRLDGIPLAIELAAARVDVFSPEQIAARLNESFNLLTGGSRTALPRQQTLRASIDWSWKLLADSEAILLRRLSIFAGGWTLDAAESVCTGNDIDSQQVLEVMTQLAEKSLVVVNQDTGRARRYHLLEMVRQYAQEKLVEAGEEENIRVQHLRYFLNLSEQIEHELVRSQQIEWFARTNDERDNIRIALEYASKTDNIEAGLYISARLQNFWESFDNYEGARWLAVFLQKPESKEYPLARAKALCAQGWFLALAQQLDTARSSVEECLALYRASGDQLGEVDGLNLRGFISISDGDKKVEYYCQQALALARSHGDIVRQATALNIMGWEQNAFNRGIAYWDEAIKLHREMGNWRSLANCLGRIGLSLVLDGNLESAQKYLDESNLLYRQLNIHTDQRQLFSAYGQIALMRGDYEQARAYFQENATVAKELGNRLDYLWSNASIGYVKLREGRITEARQVFAESAQEFQKDGYTIGLVFILECMASLYVAVGKAENAARLIGWADIMRGDIHDARPGLEQADVDRDIAAVVAKIGRDAFEDAYNKGCTMTLDEAVAYALDRG
jgi:predicted ATPase/DNA-binding SARP family transcriptional activator